MRLIERLFPEFNREEAALTAHLSARQQEDLAGRVALTSPRGRFERRLQLTCRAKTEAFPPGGKASRPSFRSDGPRCDAVTYGLYTLYTMW